MMMDDESKTHLTLPHKKRNQNSKKKESKQQTTNKEKKKRGKVPKDKSKRGRDLCTTTPSFNRCVCVYGRAYVWWYDSVVCMYADKSSLRNVTLFVFFRCLLLCRQFFLLKIN